MFFDEVKLSKKSWHYKLMKFTWGQNTPNLWSFCPYFWLSIFNFIILSFTLVIRGIQSFMNFLDRKFFLEPYKRFIEKHTEDEVFIGSIIDLDFSEKDIPKYSMFQKSRYKYDFHYEVLNFLEKKWGSDTFYDKKIEIWSNYIKMKDEEREKMKEKIHLKYLEDEKKRKEASEKRKVIEANLRKISAPFYSVYNKISSFFSKPDIYKIIKRTKQIVSFVIVSIIALIVGYYLFLGINYVYNFFKIDMNWSWKFFFSGAKNVLPLLWGTILLLTFILLINHFIVKPLRKRLSEKSLSIKIPESLKIVGKILKTLIVKPVIFLIVKPVSFFIMYFKAVKNDNCPAIIWEEETQD